MRRSLLLATPLARILTLILTLALALAVTFAPAPAAGASAPAAGAGGASPVWRAPVDGPIQVVRPFEAPPEPWAAGHRGVDLASSAGAPIRAAADGEVSFAGLVAGRGVVSLDHAPSVPTATSGLRAPIVGAPGLRTTYEPVTAVVRTGDLVRRGEVIGRLESGGSHCLDPCLHWGLRDLTAEQDALAAGSPYAGSPVYRDPMALLTRARIRLLPRFDRAPTALGQAGAAGPSRVGGNADPNNSGQEPLSSPAPNTQTASQGAGASGQGDGLSPGSAALAGLVAASAGAVATLRRLRPGETGALGLVRGDRPA
jgi:hypothetical protein